MINEYVGLYLTLKVTRTLMSIFSAAMTTSDEKITGAIPRFALGAQIPFLKYFLKISGRFFVVVVYMLILD